MKKSWQAKLEKRKYYCKVP